MDGEANEKLLIDIKRFYQLMDSLDKKVGGKRSLATCTGRMNWPRRGVYFFFEPGEERTSSGNGLRVVRVGTHGLKSGGTHTFWGRLKNHQGSMITSGGNHRRSIFRLHVGAALINQGRWPDEIARTWEGDRNGNDAIREKEKPLECAVSNHIRKMPLLWIAVDDEPGPTSERSYIERNSIALLSNSTHTESPIDVSSPSWLGRSSTREAIRGSGLWNVNYVSDDYDPTFLERLDEHIAKM